MKNFDKVREAASQHTTTPPPRAWNKLEQKLDADIVDDKRRKSLTRSRIMAGSLLLLTVSIFYLIVQESHKTPPPLAHGQIAAWEDLDHHGGDKGLYDLDNLRKLDLAFKGLGLHQDHFNGLLGNQSTSGTNLLNK